MRRLVDILVDALADEPEVVVAAQAAETREGGGATRDAVIVRMTDGRSYQLIIREVPS